MKSYSNLPCFIEVAKQSSFTKAAKILKIPLSTLSRRIEELENELGIRLLNRDTRSVSLTNEGAYVVKNLSETFKHINRVIQDIRSTQSGTKGTIKITMPSFLGHHVLSNFLFEFERHNPKVSLDIALSDKNVDLIREGFDIAIRIGKLKDSSLVCKKLWESHLQLCCGNTFYELNPQLSSPLELENQPFLAHASQPNPFLFIETETHQEIAIKPRIKMKSDNFDFLAQAAINNKGITALPAFFVKEMEKKNFLVSILPNWKLSPSKNIYLIYPHKKNLPRKNQLLIEALSNFASTFEI